MSSPDEHPDPAVAKPPSTEPSTAPSTDAAAVPADEQLVITLPDESNAPKDIGLWAGVLVILTLVTFWPATEGKFLIRDDDNLAKVRLYAAPGGLGTIWTYRWQQDVKRYPLPRYHPAAATSYWLEYHLGGRDDNNLPTPFSYHVTNLALHALAAVMLWLVLRKLKLPAAWLAAAVFALHPINTESVAWISQRATVLAGLLFFSSIYAYLLFADEEELAHHGEPTDPARRWGLYAGSLALFVMAMLSKSNAFALPFVLLPVLWWRGRLTARLAALLLPFVVIAFVLAFTAADFERDRYGLAGGDWNFGIVQRLVIASHAVWFYVAKLLAPVQLSFLYPRWAVDDQTAAAFVPVAGVVLIVIGLAIAVRAVGRGPIVAMLAFILCLLPGLALVNIQPMRWTFVADHYAYLASAVLASLVIAAIALAVRRASRGQPSGGLVVGLSAILLVALGATSWVRAHVFDDSVSLWADTVAKNAGSAFAHDRYAAALGAQADADAAAGDTDNYAKTLDTALQQARQAAALDPKDAEAEWLQGQILSRLRKPDEAIEHLRRATQIDPVLTPAWQDLAGVLIGKQQWQAAIDACDAALRVQPNGLKTHRLLGDAYAGLNDLVRAIAEYRTAIDIAGRQKTDDLTARERLGDLLARTHQDKDAVFQYTMVVQAQRDRADLWNKIGVLYARRGDMMPAIKFFEQALAIQPDYEDAKRNRELAIGAMEAQRRQAATRATTQATTAPSTAP